MCVNKVCNTVSKTLFSSSPASQGLVKNKQEQRRGKRDERKVTGQGCWWKRREDKRCVTRVDSKGSGQSDSIRQTILPQRAILENVIQ